MAPKYLNEFHKANSQACRKDLQSLRQRGLSVEDVLEQSRKFGRSTIQMISSEKALSKNS